MKDFFWHFVVVSCETINRIRQVKLFCVRINDVKPIVCVHVLDFDVLNLIGQYAPL